MNVFMKLGLVFGFVAFAASGAVAAPPEPPAISSLLKPGIYKKMAEDRDVVAYATLDRVDSSDVKEDPPKKKYRFYAGALIHSGLARTKTILTDYKIYSKIIPYIDQADYSPKTGLLELRGSFLKFQLRSTLQFIEKAPGWISYRIVGGHFAGLTGNFFFESAGERGTRVYFDGEHTGWYWPPTFIIERGAEIVFGFTARKMRTYVESKNYEDQKKQEADQAEASRKNSVQKEGFQKVGAQKTDSKENSIEKKAEILSTPQKRHP